MFYANTALFLLAMSFPSGANAGLFAFVAGIFSGGEKNSQEERILNSQTMAILEAPLNSNPNPLFGGGEVSIVGGTALMSEGVGGLSENIQDHPTSDQISIYVVREGDTLSQIAQMFGVSVNTIRWGNDINGSVISPGQTLVILPISGVRHTVAKGDTLQSIAKLYKGDLDEIKSYNHISESTSLAIGDVVIIPDGEIVQSSTSYSPTPSRTVAVSSSKVYEGYYIKPVPGTRTQGIHGFNAVDLGSPVGTPIVASASGKVIISRNSGWNGGYGKYIVIQHSNKTQTLYSHNSENIVFEGMEVVQGQVIGYVGATGKVTGPHLHFEIRGAKNPF